MNISYRQENSEKRYQCYGKELEEVEYLIESMQSTLSSLYENEEYHPDIIDKKFLDNLEQASLLIENCQSQAIESIKNE